MYVSTFKDSSISHQIKVIAEVEKIWILYDLDKSGMLDFEEIKAYLKEYVRVS